MSLRNTSLSYGSVAKFFHWLIFVLLFVMIIYGFLLHDVPKPYQGLAYNTHKLIGLSILVLMLLRLGWTLINPKPILPPNTTFWEHVAERFVHYSLYLIVIGMPIVGWIGSAAAGRSPHIGSLKLELPVPQSKGLSELAFFFHEKFAFILIFLFLIHVSAALYHHFINKDNVLRRMMPYGGEG